LPELVEADLQRDPESGAFIDPTNCGQTSQRGPK